MKFTTTPLMRLTDANRPIMYGIVLPGPDVDVGVPIVKGGDVERNRLRRKLLKKTTAEIEVPYARARLTVGDLVITIRGSAGTVREVPEELEGCNITQDVARIAPLRGINSRWLLHALSSRDALQQLEQRVTGATITGINIRDLKRILLPVPPASEQRRIADFLDARCAAIDAAIEKKERMLEAEGERKHLARNQLIAAASRHAVPLRRLLSESPRNGISPPTTDRGSIKAVLSFSLSAIRNGVVDLREDTLKSVELESHAHHPYIIRRGDVFVVRGSGNIALVGRAARLRAEPPEHCVYPDIAIRLSLGPDLDPDYLVHVFDSDIIRRQIDAAARTSNGAYKISGDDLKNLAIPIMSLSEQRRVAAQMTLDGARSDSITTALTRSIAALREYRIALITAAVTGKLELPAAPTAAVSP